MQSIRRAVLPGGITLLAVFAVLVALSSAKDEPPKKPTDLPATVIAHLPLPQATGTQMLLQREDGKNYLYVQQASKQGFMIVDVSKPDRPTLLKRTAEASLATSGNLEMVSPDVGIAETPEKKPAMLTSSNHPTETVRVLDLSDPHNPKTLQEFNGVTSLLPDGGHGLIYLTNNEGLWILRYTRPALLEPAKKKRPCDSESEIEAMPPECD
jgi:LVIVD repeat-containing protein